MSKYIVGLCLILTICFSLFSPCIFMFNISHIQSFNTFPPPLLIQISSTRYIQPPTLYSQLLASSCILISQPPPVFSFPSLLLYSQLLASSCILNSQPPPVFSTPSLLLYSQLIASSCILNSQLSPLYSQLLASFCILNSQLLPLSSQLIASSPIFSTHSPLPYLLNSQPPPLSSKPHSPFLYLLNSQPPPVFSTPCLLHYILNS